MLGADSRDLQLISNFLKLIRDKIEKKDSRNFSSVSLATKITVAALIFALYKLFRFEGKSFEQELAKFLLKIRSWLYPARLT